MMKEWSVFAADELPEGGVREFAVGDEVWPFKGFVLRKDGTLFAWVNRCPHAGHPLNLDLDAFYTADKRHLICMSHGALFEPDSGECVAGPCIGQLLTALNCEERDGTVWVTAPDSMRSLEELTGG